MNQNKNKLSPEERKLEKHERKVAERKKQKEENRRNKELASLPLIPRLFKKKRNLMIVICVILGLLCILFASMIISPGTYFGKSYNFVKYDSYVETPDTSTYSYDAGTKKDKAKEKLYDKFLAETNVKKLPGKQINHEKDLIVSQYEILAENSGMSYNDIIKSFGYNNKSWEKQLTKSAKEAVTWKLACHEYAQQHNINLNEEGYKSFRMKEFRTFGVDKKSFESVYGTSYDDYCKKYDMYSDYIKEAVISDIYSNAKVNAVKKTKE